MRGEAPRSDRATSSVSTGPQLALIRTKSVGIEFYDRVMDRMAQRPRKPRGIVLHFAGTNASELFVVTVYRDILSRADQFSDFSGPEITNELRESGLATDIGRHEFAIERLLMGADVEPIAARPLSTPRFAFLVVDEKMTANSYRDSTERARFPEVWPEGLETHLVFRHREQLSVIDIWRSREAARQHYSSSIVPSVSISLGEEMPTNAINENWIELHSLTITLAADDPLRSFSNF